MERISFHSDGYLARLIAISQSWSGIKSAHSHVTRLTSLSKYQTIVSISARPEFLGVNDDPLLENLGVIGNFRGSELFLMYNYSLSEHASILKVFDEFPLS